MHLSKFVNYGKFNFWSMWSTDRNLFNHSGRGISWNRSLAFSVTRKRCETFKIRASQSETFKMRGTTAQHAKWGKQCLRCEKFRSHCSRRSVGIVAYNYSMHTGGHLWQYLWTRRKWDRANQEQNLSIIVFINPWCQNFNSVLSVFPYPRSSRWKGTVSENISRYTACPFSEIIEN
jgi:hypothetical protein